MRLFVDTQSQTGLTVCRIKNKFLCSDFEAEDGYRDVTVNVLFEAENGLKIIGEIQVCAMFDTNRLLAEFVQGGEGEHMQCLGYAQVVRHETETQARDDGRCMTESCTSSRIRCTNSTKSNVHSTRAT